MRYLVGDTETTGLGKPPDAMACEIAIVELDAEMNVIGEWETLINPGIPIQDGASRIHGIKNEDVCRPEVPTMAQAMAEICPEGFKDVGLICHNRRFDLPYFEPHMEIAGGLCTLELARRVLPQAPNHRLGTLKTFLNLSVQAEHEGMGDVMTVVDLLRHLVPLTNRTLPQLVGAAARPSMLYTMPFGQYKGMRIADIDLEYRYWLLNQDLHPDLRYTLETLNKAFI